MQRWRQGAANAFIDDGAIGVNDEPSTSRSDNTNRGHI
jgi:hypothetical protein